MSKQCLLLRDNLSGLVETVTLWNVTLMREVGLIREFGRVLAEDLTLLITCKVVEEAIIEYTVFNGVSAVDKLLVDFP